MPRGRPFRILLLLAALSVAATTLHAQAPPFSVAPTSLGFGNVVVGTTRSLALQVTPVVGFAQVNFTLASTNPAFTVSPTKVSSVQPFTATVSFSPTSVGPFSGQINITGDGIIIGIGSSSVGAPVTVPVPVSGSGIAPFTVSAPALNFGNVPLGTPASLTFTVTPVVPSNFSVGSTDPAFAPSPTGFFAAQAQVITVVFNPKSLGPASAQILVTGEAAPVGTGPPPIALGQNPVLIPVTIPVNVSGNGIPLFGVSPAAIDFGEVVINTPSSRTFTVSPSFPASFTLSSTDPAFTVSPARFSGQSPQTVTVTFTPTAVGPFSPFSGNIQVTGQAQVPGSTPTSLSVAVSGLGVAPFSISTASLNFGSVLVGSSSVLTFTITARTLAAFTLASTDAAFSVSPSSFSSAAQQTITVTFSPMTPGPVSAQITVTGDPVIGFAAIALGSGPVFVPATLRLSASGAGVTAFSSSPASLDFGGVLLSCSALRTFTVTPAADLAFALSSDNAAFVPDPMTFSGASPQPVNVIFTPATAGQTSGAITIRASRSGQPVDTDTVPVSGAAADLALSPASVDFGGVVVGSSSHRTVSYSAPGIDATFVINSSNTNPAFTAAPSSTGQVDITFAPRAEGAASDTITLTFTRQDPGFTPCSLTRRIAVSGSGVPAGSIMVSPASLEFSGKVGATLSEQRTVAITSPQLADLKWTADAGGGMPRWLRFTPAGGGVPGALTVEVDTAGLGQGVQQAQILITPRTPDGTAQGGAATVSVRLTLTQEAPRLVVAPGVLSFAGAEGSTARLRRAMAIVNGGGGALHWTAVAETVDGRRWLSIEPAAGDAPSAATAIADLTGLAAGVYQGRLRFRAGTQEVVVPATLLVSRPGPLLSTDRAGILFEAIEGSELLPPQQFHVINTGAGSLSWTADLPTLPAWLTLSPSSGTSSASDPRGSPGVTLNASAAGLRAGIYSALVRLQSIAALNAPQFVTVILNVLRAGGPAPLDLDPGGILFVASAGGRPPAARPLEVRIGSPQALSFHAAPTTFNGGDWLSVTPASASASTSRPAAIQVRADPTNLTPAVYRGQIGVELPDGTMRSTAVTLLVTPALATLPALPPPVFAGVPGPAACDPASLVVTPTVLAGNFTARAGWPVQIEVLVTDNCSTPFDTAAVLTTFTNGDTPLEMAPQGGGLYRGTWTSSQTASQVNVTTIALAPPLAQGQAVVVGGVSQNVFPAIFKNGVVNGASFAPGAPLSPGGIVSLFGSNFGTGTLAATITPLPAVLGDVRVVVGGRAAPLFFASPGQINAQLPFEVAPAIQPQVVVQAAGQYAVPETITTVNAEPGIFILVPSVAGPDRAVAQNLDFTLNTPTNPADRGSAVIVYLTGQGSVSPAVATGATAPSTPPFATATLPADATIQGRKTDIAFLGLTPGFVGLLQAVVRIPADTTPSGTVPISFAIAGQPSNTLNIAVK